MPTTQDLLNNKNFKSLDEAGQRDVAKRFFKKNIASREGYADLSKDEKKQIAGRFSDKLFGGGGQPAIPDASTGPVPVTAQRPRENIFQSIGAPKFTPAGEFFDQTGVTPLGAVFEGLAREEAAFAEPIVRKMTGKGNPLGGVMEGLQGGTVSQFDPNRRTEIGDIYRSAGFNEPISATLGLATSLLLPSNLVPGALIGKATAKAKRLKNLRALRVFNRVTKQASRVELAENISPLLDSGSFDDAFKKLDDAGLFPDIQGRYKNALDDLVKADIETLKFNEINKHIITDNPEVLERMARFDPFSDASKARRNVLAKETAVRGIVDEYKPKSLTELIKNIRANADGTANVFGAVGKANPNLRFLDDIEKILASPDDLPIKEMNALRNSVSHVVLPHQNLNRHPVSAKAFKLARRAEHEITTLENRFGRKLENMQNAIGVKPGSIESKQISMLLDTFEDIRSIPRGANLVDEIVKRQTSKALAKNKQVIGASRDVVERVVDSIFPTKQVSPQALKGFSYARDKIYGPLARRLQASGFDTITGYFTRVYEGLIKGVQPDKKLDVLNNVARQLGVDPSFHEATLGRLGLLNLDSPAVTTKFPKFLKGRKNIPLNRRDELFLSRNLDFFDVTSNYVRNASNKVGIDEFLRATTGFADQIGANTPIGTYFRQWRDAFRGVPVGGINNAAVRNIAAWEGTRQFISKIGLRPITAIVNLTQTPLNTLSQLVADNGFRGGGKVFMQSLSDYFTQRGQKMIAGSGVLENGFISSQNFATNRGFLQKMSKATGVFFEAAENFNRGFSFLAGRNAELLRQTSKMGYVPGKANFKAANAAGRQLSDITQFIFNKSNRPLFLQTPIGSVIGRFKIFTLNQLEFFRRTLGKSPKAAATFAGMLTAIGGPDAIPMVEGLRQQMNDHHPNEPLTKALNQMQRHSIAGMLGVSFGGRLGIPLLQELELFSRPGPAGFEKALAGIMGPSVSDASNLWRFWSDVQNSGLSAPTIRNLIRIVSSQGFDIAEAWEMAQTGKITKPDGSVIYNIPEKDMVKIVAGFDPEGIAQERLRNTRRMKVDNELSQRSSRFWSMVFQGKTDGAMKMWADSMESGKFFEIGEDQFKAQMLKRIMDANQRSFFKGSSKVAKIAVPLAAPRQAE
jgi:hypothetical protein